MTANMDLSGLLARLQTARVLVVGDIMLDRYYYGSVERISPEGPIPVLKIEREAAMLGGAGNVARNLASLGADCRLITVVGDDPAGAEVKSLVSDLASVTASFLLELRRSTSIKDRYLAAGQQLLRVDREVTRHLEKGTGRALMAAVEAALPDAAVLVLSDYGKGVLGGDTATELILEARRVGCPVIVDPKGRDYGRYRGASVIAPNRRELEEASGRAIGDSADVEDACRDLIEAAGIEAVLATRSAEGMTLVRQGEHGDAASVAHFGALARDVYDVSGAGDTVVAVVAAALAAGGDLSDAARLANLTAGLVVGKVGTATVQPDEILRALHSSEILAAEEKLLDAEGLSERVAQWRRAGLKVGFTNGCFDLLHPGHISLLRQARAACDRLIVAINSDHSVERLKGPSRPVQNEAARAAVLGSLESVDRIVVFGEDTPLRLIERIKPDVLVKGADYSMDQVVGAEVVQGYGGQVLLAKLEDGHSTSATIERMGRGGDSGGA